jgi:hypothetical protein
MSEAGQDDHVDNLASTAASGVGKAEKHQDNSPEERSKERSRGWRYGLIITALCVTSCLVALEGTVVSTALPSITHDLGGGELYLWVVNAYFLSR